MVDLFVRRAGRDCAGRIEARYLIVREFHLQSAQRGIELLARARTEDRNPARRGLGHLVQYPCNSDLRR